MPLSYVLINVELGSEDEIVREILKIANVKECHRLYGIYDLIAKVDAESLDSVKQVVTSKIRKLEGVRSTVTTVVIE